MTDPTQDAAGPQDEVEAAWKAIGHALSFGTEADKVRAIEAYGAAREKRGKREVGQQMLAEIKAREVQP